MGLDQLQDVARAVRRLPLLLVKIEEEEEVRRNRSLGRLLQSVLPYALVQAPKMTSASRSSRPVSPMEKAQQSKVVSNSARK